MNLLIVELFFTQRGDAGQRVARQQFERGPAAGRDVSDLVGQARLLNRGDAVAAADDGGRVILLRSFDDGLRDGAGSLVERRLLEHAHRPVPYDRPRRSDDVAVSLPRSLADVEYHLVGGPGLRAAVLPAPP